MTTNNESPPKRKTMGIWMVLCCAIPLLLILVLGATGWGASNLLLLLALLFCPLSMIFMMVSGSGCHSSGCEKDEADGSSAKTPKVSRDL